MAPSKDSFRLGDWLVEPSLNRISRDNSTVLLQPKVIEVLVFLASRAGEAVPKREIIDTVWRIEYISENTLTRAIAELRRAFGDNARKPRYIETISKKGYRVVAPVEGLESSLQESAPPAGAVQVIVDDRSLWLEPGENIIGRGRDAFVVVDSTKASRHHARILVEGDRTVLEDLESKNGTRLNGQLIVGRRELRDGDEIRIGPKTLVLRIIEGNAATETE